MHRHVPVYCMECMAGPGCSFRMTGLSGVHSNANRPPAVAYSDLSPCADVSTGSGANPPRMVPLALGGVRPATAMPSLSTTSTNTGPLPGPDFHDNVLPDVLLVSILINVNYVGAAVDDWGTLWDRKLRRRHPPHCVRGEPHLLPPLGTPVGVGRRGCYVTTRRTGRLRWSAL